MSIRVLLADDQALFREGLETLLSIHEEIVVVGQASNGQEAVEFAHQQKPDLILMDYRMPIMDGMDACRKIKADPPTKHYRTFQFGSMEVRLSTRPQDYMSNPQVWEKAEAALGQALTKEGIEYQVNPGDGAFYGPKIDFVVLDALKRGWQLATMQLDFFLPERFDLVFTSAAGSEERPVMIHRALLGSIERFMGILIEHCGGAFPLWLAPVQARILTVTDDHKEYAKTVLERLREAGWRVEFGRNEKLGYKIREAQLAKIPYAVVIGDKEAQASTVAPRRRGGENLAAMSVGDFLQRLRSEVSQETTRSTSPPGRWAATASP